MAAELGFEPRQTESESVVLPLHNSAMFDYSLKVPVNYNAFSAVCQYIFEKLSENFVQLSMMGDTFRKK